jgi:kynurenine formamidase
VSVLDLVTECSGNAEFVVERDHIKGHEQRHGPIPAGSVVVVYTGWDRFLGTPRYLGDGPSFPGYNEAAAAELVERDIVGLGIDTAGVDPGGASGLPVHQRTAGAGIYHLEGLVGLAQLPPSDALLFAGAPPLVAGSGVPVRVLALLPPLEAHLCRGSHAARR